MAQFSKEQVDQYLATQLLGDDVDLTTTLRRSEQEGLPAIAVSALQGKLLEQLVVISGARRVLEIGTLGGYSAIHLCRGLRGEGELVTLELDQHHGNVAATNLAGAGFAACATVVVGPAVASLDRMISEGTESFDFIFIDADKAAYPQYLERSLQLSHAGTILVFDNMVRQGRILEEAPDDLDVQGTQRTLELIGMDPRLEATAIQTVGAKGWDGFVLAIVQPSS